MPRIKQTIKLPPWEGDAPRRVLKEALDAGLAHHRQAYLPLHFSWSAPHRYAGVYEGNWKVQRLRRKGRRSRTPPLVKTGRLERLVTRTGPASFRGTVNVRTMRIGNMPNYFWMDKNFASFSKRRALAAVHPQESGPLAQAAHAHVRDFLKQRVTK